MRVLIVNTSESIGGAAVAANRLMEALNNNGVKARMLVREKTTDNISVAQLSGKLHQKWAFLWERFCIYRHLKYSKQHLFEIDIANAGSDITRTREFQKADIIHLHWVNQGFLSLSDIQKIFASGKPVVWTMHDFWPATGICHYPQACEHYKKEGCGACHYLPDGGSLTDLSARVWKKKAALYNLRHVHFVACSRWLCGEVKKSRLLEGRSVWNIPNAIDTRVFTAIDKNKAREEFGLPTDKKLILFASQRTNDRRKGIDYMISALNSLVERHPEMKEQAAVVILGGQSEEVASQMPLSAYPIGFINDARRIVSLYSASDIFVLPSLEDNLPNTIMEAMACGVPCVGFNVGGIPEMIDHGKNGYVAAYKDAGDLAQGIYQMLTNADYDDFSSNAVSKVKTCYSQNVVASKYIDLYEQAMAERNYKL